SRQHLSVAAGGGCVPGAREGGGAGGPVRRGQRGAADLARGRGAGSPYHRDGGPAGCEAHARIPADHGGGPAQVRVRDGDGRAEPGEGSAAGRQCAAGDGGAAAAGVRSGGQPGRSRASGRTGRPGGAGGAGGAGSVLRRTGGVRAGSGNRGAFVSGTAGTHTRGARSLSAVPPAVLEEVRGHLEREGGGDAPVRSARPVGGGCISPCARVQVGTESFFLKW